jgi:hypothetical protein
MHRFDLHLQESEHLHTQRYKKDLNNLSMAVLSLKQYKVSSASAYGHIF